MYNTVKLENGIENNKRIEWIDIFKALTIILVVIGHATGKFNGYIYQFHVMAFFFISGIVSKMDNESIGKNIIKRFMGLIVPLGTMVILFGLVIKILSLTRYYSIFYSRSEGIDILQLFKRFTIDGNVIDLLGGSWFIWVLFWTTILSNVVYLLCGKNKYLFLVISCALYIFGCINLRQEPIYNFGMGIALVTQGLYGLAFFIAKPLLAISDKKTVGSIIVRVVLLLITATLNYLINRLLGIKGVMDLAGRQMNNIFWCSVASINGIVFILVLSQLLSLINVKVHRAFWSIVGKNTMGILLFHFFVFRLVSFILVSANRIPMKECQFSIPSEETGNSYWWIYTAIALMLSIIIWILLGKIPGLNCLLGMNKRLMGFIMNNKVTSEIRSVYSRLSKSVYSVIEDYWENIKKFNKKTLVVTGSFSIIAILMMVYYCVNPFKSYQEIEMISLDVVEGSMVVSFPFEGNNIDFGAGWIDQSPDETYRWVQEESEFQMNLSNQSSIIISGYVPEHCTSISKVELYVNDYFVEGCELTSGEGFELDSDFSEIKVDGLNTFKLVFNDEYVPSITEPDQRIYSALISSITVE